MRTTRLILPVLAVLIGIGLLWRFFFADASRDELFLYCGAGLRPAVEEIVGMFIEETGMPVRVDYNASSLLLGRMKVSRSGDLFIPGDEYYIDRAAAEGLIEASWPVAEFVPVIMVAKGNPRNIRGFEDLLREGVRMGLADARTAAVGRTARLIFAKNNISKQQIERNLVFESVTVPELATNVELGHLDAAIVWRPVAARASQAEYVEIPPELNVTAPVPVAILSFSERQEQARQFVEFIRSEKSMAVFQRHLYDPPGSNVNFEQGVTSHGLSVK